MKKITSFILFTLISTTLLFSQSTDLINYQAIVRNADNNLVANTEIGVQITVLQSETSVYSETHVVTTNDNGLITILIGNGTTSDNFSNIDWSADETFLRTEFDLEGVSNYTITTENQILSVPYAFHSNTTQGTIIDNLMMQDDKTFYFGEPDADGSWKIVVEEPEYGSESTRLSFYVHFMGSYVKVQQLKTALN